MFTWEEIKCVRLFMIYMIYLMDFKMLYYDISMQGYAKVVF